jgi:hypothetical protein
MAGTLTPTPYQTVLDGDGVAVSGAKIYTYVAGTTTNATTYTTSDLSVANTNPIVADSAGRYVAYLAAGANMRFIVKTSADVTIDDQDNVLSVPGAAVNLDIEGTVGEAVTAGQVVYMSSAAEATPLTAGLWYLTDADAAPTSTTAQTIGVAVSAIAINTAGTIRLAGLVTTAGAVTVGSAYYVSATPGAITVSAPTLSRQVGTAMTTSSLLLAAGTRIVGSIPNPITQDLLFAANAAALPQYDIGDTSSGSPRDVFVGRNADVVGTLGVSGVSTFTADLVATGASMSFQDGEGITLGTGADATMAFDGTNVALDTQAVGSGLLIVTGSEAISGVEIDNTATDGDPTLAFTLSGTSLFTMGVDDGDSDKFKIGTTAIGTSTSLTIDGSQNVGINQTTPTHKLHVVGDIKLQSSQIQLTDGYGLMWGDNSINGNAAADSLRFDTAGGERLSINSAGLVSVGNDLTVTGDVYTTAYTDYYASSTIVGWSSLTAGRRYIMTKRIGNTVFVWFHLEGTSDGTRCSFTLPITSTSVAYGHIFFAPLSYTYNNGAAVAIQGVSGLYPNATTVTCDLSPTVGDGWTASGTKIIAGQFCYEGA